VKTAVRMGLGPQRQIDPQEMHMQAIRAQSQARHSDIHTHQKSQTLISWAQGYYDQKIAEGSHGGQDLQDEAFDAARVKFGMSPRYRKGAPPPTRTTKSKLAGTSASSGGSGGDGGGRKTLTVTKEVRRMAAAAMGHIKDERTRLQEYAKLMKSKGKL
jgi:hypothetical protein